MKELSIEEKAKAYDEAIEKGKQIKNTPYTAHWDIMKEVVEHLLPELKESEDEKIRKRLAEYFEGYYDRFATDRNHVNVHWEGLEVKEILAWLAKQSKDSPVLSNSSNTGKFSWSEEDEKISSAIIKRLKGSDALSVDLQRAICWIDYVKDRVLPQPKQEWSEEDKRKIDRIYSILRQAADTHAFSTSCRLIGDKECIELQDFLKSIQSQWKPSKEQMKALASTLSLAKSCGEESTFNLSTLYEQLKKL